LVTNEITVRRSDPYDARVPERKSGRPIRDTRLAPRVTHHRWPAPSRLGFGKRTHRV